MNVQAGHKGFVPRPFEERLWEKIDRRGPDECWPWIASGDPRGYGVIWIDGRRRRASQVVWELTHGLVIGRGEMACHHCDNPPCCNPAHIFVGTMRDNIRDALTKGRLHAQRQTHCKYGHEFTPENTSIHPRGWRICRICIRRRKAKHLARQALDSTAGEKG